MTTATPPIRVVIVDHDAESRRRLRLWLGTEAGAALVGEAAGLDAAIPTIRRRRPHVAFIHPDPSGPNVFETFARIAQAFRPQAVFVDGAASDASRAFELDAVDFIVRPAGLARLSLALARVRRRLAESRVASVIPVVANRLPVRVAGRILLLPIDSIRSLHACNVLTEIHADDGVHRVHQPLRDVEARLPSDRFVRVHRSAIIQVARVRQLRPKAHGDGAAVMDDGREIAFSRSHRAALREALFVLQRPAELGRASAA